MATEKVLSNRVMTQQEMIDKLRAERQYIVELKQALNQAADVIVRCLGCSETFNGDAEELGIAFYNLAQR